MFKIPSPSPAAETAQVASTGWLRRVARVGLWLLLAGYFALGLGYLAFRYYVWPNLDDWRPRIERELSQLSGQPVRLGRIETGFDGFRPRLTLENLSVGADEAAPEFRVDEATAVLSLRSFAMREVRLASLLMTGPQLIVERTGPRQLRVGGLPIDLDAPGEGRGLDLLLEQRGIRIDRARVRFLDRTRGLEAQFDRVDLELDGYGYRHTLSLRIGEVPTLAAGLRLSADAYLDAGARASDFGRWRGEAYAETAGAAWRPIARLLQLEDLPLERANGDLMSWVTFGAGRIDDAQVRFALRDVDWNARTALPSFAQATGTAQMVRQRDGAIQVTVPALSFDDGRGFALTAQGSQELGLDPQGRMLSGRAQWQAVDAAAVLDAVRRIRWPQSPPPILERLTASGRIGSVSAQWQRADADAPWHYSGEAQFSGLGVQVADDIDPAEIERQTPQSRRPRMPSFANLGGTLRVDQDGGSVEVRGDGSALTFPGVFAEPRVPFDQLAARARWKVDPPAAEGRAPQVAVTLEELKFANADAAGSARGAWRNAQRGPGVLDLQGRLTRADATKVARYLPIRLAQDVRDWVGRAITAGRSDDVQFVVKGDLFDFPFVDPARGQFRVAAKVRDGGLDYVPDWPPIQAINGDLVIERIGMDLAIRSAQVYGVALSAVSAKIPDFEQAHLRIEGEGNGPAQDMIRYVNQSPIRERIDDFTADTRVQGPARLQLRLDLPLKQKESMRIAGTVQLAGNDLLLQPGLPPFDKVSGRLEFSERGIELRGVQAQFLGGPIKAEAQTPEPGRFQLRAEGTATAEALRALIEHPVMQKVDGSATYRATMETNRRGATLVIDSELVGVSSALPAPVTKPAEASWPLKIEVGAQAVGDARPTADQIRVSLRDDLRGVFERRRDPQSQRMLVTRGAFAINGEPQMQDSGFALFVNRPELDVDAWRAVLATEPAAGTGNGGNGMFAPGFTLLPTSMTALSANVRIANKDLHDVVFGASRVGGFWRANIASREVNGFFNWRDAAIGQKAGTLVARFGRLEIPKSRASEVETLLDTSPASLPGLDIAAEEFILNDHRLGSLTLKATNSGDSQAPIWKLEELQLVHPTGTLRATGSWATRRSGAERHGISQTSLDFDLAMSDAGGLLGAFGQKDVLKGGEGKLGGSVSWNGSPITLDYGSLGGKLRLDMGSGQFLKTDPGIAKLISVVNLQSLPRRLSLDFRDIFAEGFAFDSIHSDVAIDGGVARTDNMQMRGVQARVQIRGQADIAKETQALEVEVRPELNAGLASLAYAAVANPAVGLGSFIAQMVLRRPLQDFFTYHYDVSGSWADPKVTEKKREIVTEEENRVLN